MGLIDNILLLILLIGCVSAARGRPKTDKFKLLMPNAKPTKPETYLCTPVKMDENKTHYIGKTQPTDH